MNSVIIDERDVMQSLKKKANFDLQTDTTERMKKTLLRMEGMGEIKVKMFAEKNHINSENFNSIKNTTIVVDIEK